MSAHEKNFAGLFSSAIKILQLMYMSVNFSRGRDVDCLLSSWARYEYTVTYIVKHGLNVE